MAAGRLKRMASPAVSESTSEARQQHHGLNLAVSSSSLPPLSSSSSSPASSPPSSSPLSSAASNGTLDEGEGEENNKNKKLAGPLYFSVDRMDSLFLARPTRVRRCPETEPFYHGDGERCAVAVQGGAKEPETKTYNHHNHHNHRHHSPHRRRHRHHQAGELQQRRVSCTEAPGLGLNRGDSRLHGKCQDGMNSDGFFCATGDEKEMGKVTGSSATGNGLMKETPCLSCDSGLVNGNNKAVGGCGVQRSNGAISLNSASPGKGNSDKSRWHRLQTSTNTSASDFGLLLKGSSKIPNLEYGCGADLHSFNPVGVLFKPHCGEINLNCLGTENENTKKHSPESTSTNSNTISHHNSLSIVSSQNNISVSQDEVSAQSLLVASKQAEIRSRAHRLCKRLQVVQAKQVERHAQQQLAGLVGHSLKQFSSSFTESLINNCSSTNNKHTSTLHGNSNLQVGPLLLRSNLPRTNPEGGADGGIHSSPSSSLKFGESNKCLLSSLNGDTFSGFVKDRAISEDLLKLVSSVTAKLRTSERAFDSDATESSSGGETDLEEDGTSGAKLEYRHAILHRRLEWRWAVERAAIVNRWTWLQAQVSDLEYRIRQQTDIYRQIRANKGPVVLGDAQLPEDLMKHQCRLVTTSSATGLQGPETHSSSSSADLKVPIMNNKCELSPCSPSLLLRNVDKQSSRLTQSLGNLICPSSPSCSSPSSSSLLSKVCTPPKQLNGLLNSPLDNSSLDSSDTEEILSKKQRLDGLNIPPSPPDNSCVAARVRPVRRYRKRRLVRSNLACYLGRKAQRPLSIKCSCDWPTACILCGSKTLMQTMDQTSMPPQERVAIMEPCYHPILSLPQDTPLHVHFEGLLKEEEHQKQPQKFKSLRLLSQVKQRPQDSAKKVCQKLASSLLSSAKYVQSGNASEKIFKRRLDHWQPTSKSDVDPLTEKLSTQIKKQRAPVHLAFSKRHKAASSSYPPLLNPQTPKPSSVVHQLPSYTDTPPSAVHNQPATSNTSTPSARRRRGESSFDINNIVIPMSMAAAARVEKLQYKEILTPSWRIADIEQSKQQNGKLEDDQYEEMSDEAFLSRHSKCEEMERSRWCLWSSSSSARRGSRSSNKADGRSTPQPQQTNVQPASPDSGYHLLNDYPQVTSFTGPVSPEACSSLSSFSSKDRTRVLSFSEDTRSSTPEVTDDEVQMVQPWEPRIFPLSAEDLEALKGHCNSQRENRCERSRDLHWLSASKPGVRTEAAECAPSLSAGPSGPPFLQDDDSSNLKLTLAIENDRSMVR
ncbi:KAT8 regulatory NSL complex subunit 1-like isoform X2 [Pristis pectinata]|uniref:KAT8 regulatory NSL complex subunit 1-like isoform X2 n=1 Tax=Pristis pectinata TaxID=685728 RepID=UPI00223D9B0C|nr:KAT8 regulatory NSL complex subunit 1-like isoform X2 [Pristis pectinata]